MGMVEIDEDTLGELTSLLRALKDSGTPGLTERISGLLAALGVVAAEVEPIAASTLVEAAMDNAEGLSTAIRQLGDWQRNGAWKSLAEAVSLVSALQDSATPHIAERLAAMAVGLGRIAGEAGPGVAETVSAVEANGSQLAHLMRQVAAWQEDGTWDALAQFATLLKGFNDSLTPPIVERVVAFASNAAISLRDAIDAGLLDLGIRTMDALYETAKATREDTSRVTVMSLMRSLKDPEMQHAVKLVTGLLRRVPQIIADQE